MSTDRIRLAADDARDPLRDMLSQFMGEQGAQGRLRVPSDLTWEPPTDIIETEGEIVVTIDIAGMDGKDIAVVTDGRTLRVSGTRRPGTVGGVKQFHQLEIRSGPFERSIELPSRVDPGKVSAQYTRGLLEVRVRKLDPSEYVKRVKIG